MARLSTVGFEMQSTGTGVEHNGALSGTASINTTTKRSGSASLRSNPSGGSGYVVHRFRADATARCFVRFYLYISSLPSADTSIFKYGDGTFMALHIVLRTTGALALYKAQGITQVGSDSSALSTSTWYRIEFDYNDASGDGMTAYINGTSFASGTGDDINGGGVIHLGAANSTTDLYFDDVACNDDTGSYQTGLPGEGKIVVALPTGAGDNAADAGTYAGINEIPPSDTVTDTTTRIDLDTTTSIGDYAMTDSSTLGIGSSDTITLVDVYARVREESIGTSNYTLRIKSASGGTVSASGSVDGGNTTIRTNPSGTTAFGNRLVSYVDPTTSSAWTPTGTNSIDNMQCGVATTDGSPDIWVAWLGAMVEYVASTALSVSVSDSITTTDTATIRSLVSASDSVTIVDTPTIRVVSRFNVSDTATLTDTPSVRVSVLPTVSDSVTVTDTPTISIITPAINLSVSVSDSTTVTDTPTIRTISYLNVSDSTTVSDTPTLSLASRISASDTATLTDSPTLSLTSNISVSDTTTLTDTPTLSFTSVIFVSDSTAVTDAPTLTLTTNIAVSDQATVSESVNLSLTSYISVSDSTTVADTTTIEVSAPQVSVSDTTTLSESVTVAVSSPQVSVSDETTVSEQATLNIPILHLSVSDSATVSETVNLLLISLGAVNVADSTTVTDEPTVFIPTLVLSVEDTATASEQVSVEIPALLVLVDDEVIVLDTTSLNVPVRVAAADSVQVSELVSVVKQTPGVTDYYTGGISLSKRLRRGLGF